jgi:predicted TIM-barrel fold metal-dependent hydrolase
MEVARFRGLVRPVHPEFYCQRQSQETAEAEADMMRTVMRIDPFLDLMTGPAERRKRMLELSNIEPVDAGSWRSFLDYWFEQAAGSGAVGIKQLQAYRRNLEFAPSRDDEIRWSNSSEPETRKRQDWIVQECCRQAHERGWVHQVHVGTHNLPHSSPLPLAPLARRYPAMKIVMIHCWPFLEEAGTLARQVANIYIDTCWQPILNPEFFRTAMSQWWNYVPTHKITCGHDATTVEMAAGSALFTREILADVLSVQTRHSGFNGADLRKAAQQVLYDNAAQLYGPV